MKKTVAVIFGGRSAEHDVSIITAYVPIIQALNASGEYHPIPVYITTDGAWYSDPAMADLGFFKRPDVADYLATKRQVQLSFENGFHLIWPGGLRPKRRRIDVVFPSMHGTFGEDGSLMGLLRMAGVPYVGCTLEASAIAMDKVLTKLATEPLGIPSVPYVWFTAHDWARRPDDFRAAIKQKLKYPLFVKPVHLGSSIAITPVEKPELLENAIEVALHYDDKVIVEQGVQNLIEVTLPIIGNDELIPAHVEEILAKFFDFEEKYLKGHKKGGGGANSGYSNIPAKISPALTKRVQELGEATYRAIGATGIARVDFLIDGKTHQVFMNEVNTLPGSLYVHNWKQKGVSAVELVTRLIRLAEERHQLEKRKTYVFKSDILGSISGPKFQI
jgi:D-alanine-D-alanine ligase